MKSGSRTTGEGELRTLFASILDSEIVQSFFEAILRGEAGIHKVATQIVPLAEAAIVEHLEVILDDEGDDAPAQALFK